MHTKIIFCTLQENNNKTLMYVLIWRASSIWQNPLKITIYAKSAIRIDGFRKFTDISTSPASIEEMH